MTRLIVVVEGQTEEAFVKAVLAPHLFDHEVFTSATIVGKVTAQRRGHRGRGGGHFSHWRKDIERILGGDRNPDLRVTTLFDLYGLPDDFPDLDAHNTNIDTNQRCDDLQAALGNVFGDHRLFPYLQRHEFEALVLASLQSLRELLDAEDDLAGLDTLERQISGLSPEDINDDRETAPSKRLLTLVPGYSKTLHGPLAIDDTEMPALRASCPRFNNWVRQLERLKKTTVQ